MKKILSISALAVLISPPVAYAVCPVCTVAVGVGVGLAKWLGIDDTISGLWIGGFTASLTIWTINWLDKRKIKFYGRKILVTVGYYLIIVGPLWWQGIIGHPYNKFCGIDRLLFGIALGTLLFLIGVVLHNYLRKRNDNKSYFKGQKIVMAISPLIIASIIFYLTC